jgi:hypothetical protein
VLGMARFCMEAPIFTHRGVTYQTDRKDLAEVMEHLYMGVLGC